MLMLGFTGPSLTRMLILWPLYSVLAVLGFGYVFNWRRYLRIPLVLSIVFVGTSDVYRYLLPGAHASEEFSRSFIPGPTAIGQTVSALPAGQRILCVVSRDRNVVKYLTSNAANPVRIEEFNQRALDPSLLPIKEFQPSILFIENTPAFMNVTSRLPPDLFLARTDRFYEVRIAGL